MSKLLKIQKGKCTHCGLTFRDGDIWEVDHITPKILGGKDEYQNLQLIHRHCHDVKIACDGSYKAGCANENGQYIEEPCEVKVCAVVRTD
jgi:RNA-directed DNA polymerase